MWYCTKSKFIKLHTGICKKTFYVEYSYGCNRWASSNEYRKTARNKFSKLWARIEFNWEISVRDYKTQTFAAGMYFLLKSDHLDRFKASIRRLQSALIVRQLSATDCNQFWLKLHETSTNQCILITVSKKFTNDSYSTCVLMSVRIMG